MIKQRFFQLMVIALLCMLVAGCKKDVKQADEMPITKNEVLAKKSDLPKDTSSNTTEVDDKDGLSEDKAKESEKEAKEDAKQPAETSVNNDESEPSEPIKPTDSAQPSDDAPNPGDEIKADSVSVDTTVVDSLWDHLLVDAKIMSDTTLSQADYESVNRDSLLEVAKKQKLDSLLIGVIHPADNAGTGSTESGGWPWWMTLLAGVAGLLIGGLLTWLISKFTRKKGRSSGDEKENKPKLKIQELSELNDKKTQKLVDFYKRMIIK